MTQYPLSRDDRVLGQFRINGDTPDIVYVYRRFSDRIDIYKLSRAEMAAAGSFSELLSVREPDYRFTGGGCSCPGASYHAGHCKHKEVIEDIEW